jgi:hypothetical protein
MDKNIQIENLVWIIKTEFKTISGYLKKTEIDKLSLGMSGMYLNSILELLYSTKLLLKNGFLESAGAVATSLWERSIAIQYILTDPIILSRENASHNFMKKMPWNVKKMICGIVDNEKIAENRDRDIEIELLYFQYSFLCAIKHGNPYTLSYLNRHEKNTEKKKPIGVTSNISADDEDIKSYILLLCSSTSLDALVRFSQHYCNVEKIKSLKKVQKEIEIMIKEIPLKLPPFIRTNLSEIDNSLLKHLRKIFK